MWTKNRLRIFVVRLQLIRKDAFGWLDRSTVYIYDVPSVLTEGSSVRLEVCETDYMRTCTYFSMAIVFWGEYLPILDLFNYPIIDSFLAASRQIKYCDPFAIVHVCDIGTLAVR